jgi:hypothetical protein
MPSELHAAGSPRGTPCAAHDAKAGFDGVVRDNLSSHKIKGVRELRETVGAEVLYLPPTHPTLTRSKRHAQN